MKNKNKSLYLFLQLEGWLFISRKLISDPSKWWLILSDPAKVSLFRTLPPFHQALPTMINDRPLTLTFQNIIVYKSWWFSFKKYYIQKIIFVKKTCSISKYKSANGLETYNAFINTLYENIPWIYVPNGKHYYAGHWPFFRRQKSQL